MTITGSFLLSQKRWRKHPKHYCRYNYRKTITLKKIIGKSPAILEAVSLAQKVAKTDASVLQTGETGTRKYVFARLIHNDSQRSG